MKQYILGTIRLLNRKLFSINWKDLRNINPISDIFGLERGTPVDRFYIERFLEQEKKLIYGTVLEIGDNYYSEKNNSGIQKQEVSHFTHGNSKAAIVVNLTNKESLKAIFSDCFIGPQTLNFIYDIKSAVEGIYHVLKNEGYALVTLIGI